MNIEKLKQQQADIAAQIVKAEAIEKNRVRVEKLVLKLLAKYPDFYLADAKRLEEHLAESFAAVAEKMKSSPA